MKSVPLACTSVACLAAAWSAQAAAPTKDACIEANETGQDLRRDGKLTQARERFELCSSSACPGIVQEDCIARLAETRSVQPTVTFVAKNPRGEPISGVSIRLDERATVASSGTPIDVDPGEHRFEVLADGSVRATRTLTLIEGQHAREEVVLAPTIANGRVGPPARASGTRRTIGLVAGGVGLAAGTLGVVLGAMASHDYDSAKADCGGDPGRCTDPDAVARGDDAQGLQTAARIALVSGVLLLVGGVVLFLTAPKASADLDAALARSRRLATW